MAFHSTGGLAATSHWLVDANMALRSQLAEDWCGMAQLESRKRELGEAKEEAEEKEGGSAMGRQTEELAEEEEG